MKTLLSVLLAVLFVVSFLDSSSASLNIEKDSSSVAANEEPELYCGLALPPEGEQGGQGQDTEQGQEDSPSPSPTPSPESKSNSQSDEEPSQN